MAKPTAIATTPDFITTINNDYGAQIAHVFVLHGNVYDYCDSSGRDLTVSQVFGAAYDDAVQSGESEDSRRDKQTPGLVDEPANKSKVSRILVKYNISSGLEIAHPSSYQLMKDAFTKELGKDKVTDAFMAPTGVGKLIEFMNLWFRISIKTSKTNRIAREEKTGTVQSELLVTWLIQDADVLFPVGPMSQIGPDRVPIVSVRQWAQDDWLGLRNRIILLTRHASDLHPSILSEISSIHMVRKPNLKDREDYINGFNDIVKRRAAATPAGQISIGGNKNVKEIVWGKEFSAQQCAIQSAGMNRRQLKDVFLQSWIDDKPVTYDVVIRRKQRALQDEYAGMLDFKEPTFGFEEIGGNNHFKEYCTKRIINPLKEGDTKTCSRGALMTGPPGTGKSMLAMALAKEAQLNFMVVDLGKVFAGLVGETEKNMRKLLEAIEAASPCIVFCDEIDSVLSAGRSSGGDSGTSGRVFNSFMTFLSDPGRVGRVVVLGASNRPDLLDKALIRPGRFDAKIPILPPSRSDAKGRMDVLNALTIKHKVLFDKSVQGTQKDPSNGLGRLVLDKERIWTGAEIEDLIREAMSSAADAKRLDKEGKKDYTIFLADWNYAMDVIIPNTGDIELQTRLALEYVNNLSYCPKDYWDEAKEVQARRQKQLAEGDED